MPQGSCIEFKQQERDDDSLSTIAFYIDEDGETEMQTEIRCKKDKLALLQFIKMQTRKLEAEIEQETFGRSLSLAS